ncbi:MAG: hypothetical protein A07HN63_00978 [uncultured archaeon A07HN63]|jgi:hypothetical protein|nr:MAG: hypothetical protein A07HN63_00978 [uncultured archaeon A07HN63]
MSDVLEDDLYERTKALLDPGDIELVGLVIHTEFSSEEDLEMHELTVDCNEIIADHTDKGESYIYAGNDDPEFASNQFHGRTLDDDEFVWECQQLLRDGRFHLVFYYEATADHEGIIEALEDRGLSVTPVP